MGSVPMPGGGPASLGDNKLLQINLSTQILCYTLVTSFVIIRFIIERRLGIPISLDDVTCCIAWLLFMGYCTCALIYGFSGGADKAANLTVSEIESSFKVSYASTIIYAPLALFVKVTLLLVLAKIYKPSRLGTIAIDAILGLNLFYYITILFVKVFICSPVSAYWTSMNQPSEDCLNRFAVIATDSTISVISDVAILVLPVVLTWPLQMAVRVKMRVMALLGLGGIAVGFSLYRLVLVISDRNTPDQTILFMRVLLSGNAEGGIGLICACLPALSRYLRHRRGSIKSAHEIQNHQYPIFDGSQICNAAGSAPSRLETHIWRSSIDSDRSTMLHEIPAPSCSSPMAIRKNITVRQHSDNVPP
ncbi:hypothetical protein BJX63DRAFT_386314 [Aspergillus granulosus]|uniref:Rhodopsin domain-containing protein n=1 Tax=Aspergillus granulosus TaxID=176169 RepID=A0ABR4HNX4_9EURO